MGSMHGLKTALDTITARRNVCSRSCLNTIRTARSRTSGEYLADFAVSLSSQAARPPVNLGVVQRREMPRTGKPQVGVRGAVPYSHRGPAPQRDSLALGFGHCGHQRKGREAEPARAWNSGSMWDGDMDSPSGVGVSGSAAGPAASFLSDENT